MHKFARAGLEIWSIIVAGRLQDILDYFGYGKSFSPKVELTPR